MGASWIPTDDGARPVRGGVRTRPRERPHALDDGAGRSILEHLEAPTTAAALSEATGIPLSTTYRKLDLLAEASLVDSRTGIREDGHHTTRYVVDFEGVYIGLAEGRAFEVGVERPARTADQRPERLRSEVRMETRHTTSRSSSR